MEVLLIALSVIMAASGVIVAVVVLTKVVRLPAGARTALRPWSTAGFRWLVLGIASTVLFALLDLSIVPPLLVALGGLVAVVVGVYRQWKNRS